MWAECSCEISHTADMSGCTCTSWNYSLVCDTYMLHWQDPKRAKNTVTQRLWFITHHIFVKQTHITMCLLNSAAKGNLKNWSKRKVPLSESEVVACANSWRPRLGLNFGRCIDPDEPNQCNKPKECVYSLSALCVMTSMWLRWRATNHSQLGMSAVFAVSTLWQRCSVEHIEKKWDEVRVE